MNPPQILWDHLDREQNKRQPTSKEELFKCTARGLENYS